jgi:peptidoglycan/xylan/chitin deacetylase (PgdA/CDA1 family)
MHAGKASAEPDCGPTACRPGQVSSFRGNTVAALPTIIAFYRAHGYTFVTL